MSTMTTMHDLLTDEDLSNFVINPEILRYLELFREKITLEKHDINVLDWGCGRGRSVSLLRDMGYNTFGVDICAESLSNGNTYFSKKPKYPANMLRLISPKGKIDFPDNYFHFIFSYQVLEHVEHIEDLADEITRVLAPGGTCLHIYPAHKRVIEGHLFMPFIHWLPKNNIRKAFITLFVTLGIEPRWRELKDKNILGKAQAYYNFSVNETFYRSPVTNKKIFEQRGLQTDFVIINNPILRKHGVLSRIMNVNYLKKLINWMLLNFKSVEILLVKP